MSKPMFFSKKFTVLLCLILLLSFLVSFEVFADESEKGVQSIKQEEIIFLDSLGRDTPRGTAKGFLDATRERDYKKAAQFIDIRFIPQEEAERKGPELARKFKKVLDQKLVGNNFERISNLYEGNLEDGMPSYQEVVGILRSKNKVYPIIFERIFDDEENPIWKISSITAKEIPSMREEFSLGILERFMPQTLMENQFLGIKVAEWLITLCLILFSFFLVIISGKILSFFLKKNKNDLLVDLLHHVSWPLRWLLISLMGAKVLEMIAFSATFKAVLKAKTIIIIFFVWFLFKVVDFLFHRWGLDLKKKGKKEVEVLINLFRKIVKIFIILIGGGLWLENVGFELTTILAGFGIGGIALAMAAQKSIEDLLGAVTLLGANPVRVGNFIRFGDNMGTVEEIGMRYTKVRTLGRTLLNIPNGKFANLQLENFSAREKMWYHPNIHLRYDTSAEKISEILDAVHKVLKDHPKVLSYPARIRFQELSSHSLRLAVFAYIDERDYGKYLKIAEELNLEIKKIVEKSGAQFAIPLQGIWEQEKK